MEPRLTEQDFRVLRVLFGYAHQRGEMTDGDFDRAIVILKAADVRQREYERELLEEVMG